MEHKTIFSPCRRYRYSLWRVLNMVNPAYVMFIGLNPSTADEVRDDPTVRRCIGYAKRWGYGALCMTNIFGYRATDPREMKAQKDPIGPENDRWLIRLAEGTALVVAAWGVHGRYLKRGEAVARLLSGKLSCLGTTKDGYPRHPLYLPLSAIPITWCILGQTLQPTEHPGS